MKKKSLFVSLIVTGLIIAGIEINSLVVAEQTQSTKVKQLIAYSLEANGGKAIDTFKQLTSKEKDELKEYMETNSQDLSPIYFMLMADHIYKSDKNKAVLWYYIGKIRAYEDVSMCKDKTAQAQVDIYPALAPKTLKYLSTKLQDRKYIASVLQQALDWDISHPDRISPIWACYHGMSAFSQEPALIDAKKQQDVYKKFRKEIQESIDKYYK